MAPEQGVADDIGDDHDEDAATHGTSRCWETGRKVESTIPKGRVDRHHLDGGRIVAFEPVLEDGTIQFDIDLTPAQSGTGSHHRRLHRRHPEESDITQIVARWPREMARIVQLTNPPQKLAEDEGRTLHWQSTEQHCLRVRPEPEISPWMPSDISTVGQVVVEDTRKLVPLHMEDSEKRLQLALNIPKEAVDQGVLAGGDKVATRLTARDGGLAVALDLDVGTTEEDEPYVRTVFKQSHGPDQWTTYMSQQLMDALGWSDIPLDIVVEPTQIILQPA